MSGHYWNAMNLVAYRKFKEAADKLETAWGYGGSTSYWPMRTFSDWFEDLYDKFVEMDDANELCEEVKWAALDACADMLAFAHINQDRHLKYIVRIRHRLRPDDTWDDESEDEDDCVFQMEMDDA